MKKHPPTSTKPNPTIDELVDSLYIQRVHVTVLTRQPTWKVPERKTAKLIKKLQQKIMAGSSSTKGGKSSSSSKKSESVSSESSVSSSVSVNADVEKSRSIITPTTISMTTTTTKKSTDKATEKSTTTTTTATQVKKKKTTTATTAPKASKTAASVSGSKKTLTGMEAQQLRGKLVPKESLGTKIQSLEDKLASLAMAQATTVQAEEVSRKVEPDKGQQNTTNRSSEDKLVSIATTPASVVTVKAPTSLPMVDSAKAKQDQGQGSVHQSSDVKLAVPKAVAAVPAEGGAKSTKPDEGQRPMNMSLEVKEVSTKAPVPSQVNERVTAEKDVKHGTMNQSSEEKVESSKAPAPSLTEELNALSATTAAAVKGEDVTASLPSITEWSKDIGSDGSKSLSLSKVADEQQEDATCVSESDTSPVVGNFDKSAVNNDQDDKAASSTNEKLAVPKAVARVLAKGGAKSTKADQGQGTTNQPLEEKVELAEKAPAPLSTEVGKTLPATVKGEHLLASLPSITKKSKELVSDAPKSVGLSKVADEQNDDAKHLTESDSSPVQGDLDKSVINEEQDNKAATPNKRMVYTVVGIATAAALVALSIGFSRTRMRR